MQTYEYEAPKNEERRQQIEALMQMRMAQRKQRNAEGSPAATAAAFLKQFNDTKQELEQKLNMTTELALDDRKDHINAILDEFVKLKASLADASGYLAAYDTQQCQQKLDALEQLIERVRSDSGVKKKFVFCGAKKNDPSTSTSTNEKPSSTTEPSSVLNTVTAKFDASGGVVSGLTNQTVHLGSQSENGIITLENLVNCTVINDCISNTLHCHSLINCKVYFAPISSSVFIDQCKGCTFELAARQIRLVGCDDCDMYIYVQSKPTIEDCTNLRAAPYNLKYASVEKHLSECEFDLSTNQVFNVQDFNWPRPNTPNWRPIPEQSRQEHSI